jgi:hypothetical protein
VSVMTPHQLAVRWSTFMAVLGAVVVAACSSYGGDATVSLPTPPRESFGVLSSVLEPHCGTLDCHGGPARNFRVYGKKGIRALGNDTTGAAIDTNESDVEATYQSIVSIDPEVLSRVFQEHGRDPQRWIVLSKARGLEHHIGGTRFAEGSPGDRCLVSWVSGTLDPSACAADMFGPVPRPGEPW